MSVDGAIHWLRVSYWAGAIPDAVAALTMLYPPLFAATNRLGDFHPGADYRYALGMGASLMLGWTALLLWADRKPLERRGVLMITTIPVVLGLVVNEAVAVGVGFLTVGATAPVWALQVAISILFVFSYSNAGRASGGQRCSPTAP